MIKETFTPFERKDHIPASGQYIYVEKAMGDISIWAKTTDGQREYVMREREKNIVPIGEEFTELTIENQSEQTGEIIVRYGFGNFTPSNDHQKVIFDNEINLPSNITFASSQPVHQAAGASFNTIVSNFPAEQVVSFKGNQPVTIENGQAINVEISNPVEAVSIIESDPVINGLADIAIDGTAQTIPAKVGRKGLLLQAPISNNGDIIVQGFLRVEAGAVVPFPASNAVTIQGSAGDVLYVGEQM